MLAQILQTDFTAAALEGYGGWQPRPTEPTTHSFPCQGDLGETGDPLAEIPQ